MHRFQPSRGRILFEVFCALAVVASMVGAWQQTHASALLTAAAAAGLYAMVHLFDLVRHEPAQAAEPQRIEFEPEPVAVQPTLAADIPPQAAEVPLQLLEPEPAIEVRSEPETVGPAPRTSAGRRTSGSRKGGGRRASGPKGAKVVELAPALEADIVEPAPIEEVEIAGIAHVDEVEAAMPAAQDEADDAALAPPEPVAHVPHAPLFEPEPFVRMQRQAFGRRGRL